MAQQQGTTGGTYEFSTKDFLKSFLGVVKTVVIKPSEFFQNMPTTGGFLPPFVFLVICIGVCLILGGILAALLGVLSDNLIWSFFTFFIALVLFSFIGAGILHYISQQFFEGKGTYEGMYRVWAYAGVFYLMTWLPVVAFFAFFYWVYLQVVGVKEVHKVTAGQAVVTVLIALAVYIIAAVLSIIPLPGMRVF